MHRNSLPKLNLLDIKNSLERKQKFTTNIQTRGRRSSVKENHFQSPNSLLDFSRKFETYYIQVIFLSNYGNQSLIGCSEIDVLDENYRVLRVESIALADNKKKSTSEDEDDEDPLNLLKIKHKNESIPPYLSTLVNSSMIKNSNTQEWNSVWKDEPIYFNIKVLSMNPPACVRIWNSATTDHRSVKNVKILAGETFIASGTVPERFGTIISLEQSRVVKKDVFSIPFPVVPKTTHSDSYGEIPIRAIKLIKFHLLESFDKSDYVGLDSIEIAFETGQFMTINDVKSINFDNISFLAAPHKLINNAKEIKTSRTIDDMWIGSMTHQGTPQIAITLKKAMPVLFIRIWNIPVQVDNSCFGVKKMTIFFENEIVAMRTLRKRTKKNSLPTDFWFTDVPSFKQRVQL